MQCQYYLYLDEFEERFEVRFIVNRISVIFACYSIVLNFEIPCRTEKKLVKQKYLIFDSNTKISYTSVNLNS